MSGTIDEIMVDVLLTDEEKARFAEALSDLVVKMESLETEKKGYDAMMNAKIKEIEAEARGVAAVVSSGVQEKLVECEIHFDNFHKEAVYQSLETGEIVRTRPMTKEEMQRTLPFLGKKSKPINNNQSPCWFSRIPIRQNFEVDFSRVQECWDAEYLTDWFEHEMRPSGAFVDEGLTIPDETRATVKKKGAKRGRKSVAA